MRISDIIKTLDILEEDQGNRKVLGISIIDEEIEISFEDVEGELMCCNANFEDIEVEE